MLEYLGLADEVWRLVEFDHWHHIFGITNPAYHELTLEVLNTFEIDRAQARLCLLGWIRFQVQGVH